MQKPQQIRHIWTNKVIKNQNQIFIGGCLLEKTHSYTRRIVANNRRIIKSKVQQFKNETNMQGAILAASPIKKQCKMEQIGSKCSYSTCKTSWCQMGNINMLSNLAIQQTVISGLLQQKSELSVKNKFHSIFRRTFRRFAKALQHKDCKSPQQSDCIYLGTKLISGIHPKSLVSFIAQRNYQSDRFFTILQNYHLSDVEQLQNVDSQIKDAFTLILQNLLNPRYRSSQFQKLYFSYNQENETSSRQMPLHSQNIQNTVLYRIHKRLPVFQKQQQNISPQQVETTVKIKIYIYLKQFVPLSYPLGYQDFDISNFFQEYESNQFAFLG